MGKCSGRCTLVAFCCLQLVSGAGWGRGRAWAPPGVRGGRAEPAPRGPACPFVFALRLSPALARTVQRAWAARVGSYCARGLPLGLRPGTVALLGLGVCPRLVCTLGEVSDRMLPFKSLVPWVLQSPGLRPCECLSQSLFLFLCVSLECF